MFMRFFVALFMSIAPAVSPAVSLLVSMPAAAQVMSIETYTEQWDPVQGEWVRLEEGAQRLVQSRPAPQADAIAQYGPFRVLDAGRAALMGGTDAASPAFFAAMLRDFPQIAMLDMIECPGTGDDRANMRLGRMIRAAGLTTRVPAGGSVRSGAVELFLAGVERQIDDGAEFAVHSWRDEYGREANDFAADAAVNRSYRDYYQEMGMAADESSAFYDMTNSVPHETALWLTAQDMRAWMPPYPRGESADNASGEVQGVSLLQLDGKAPQLAYADMSVQLDLEVGFP